jgi:hypothetical protein
VSAFDVESYLNHRDDASPFTMVEIGHGPNPVVFKQLGFSGLREYIGIEAGLRDRRGGLSARLTQLKAAHPEQNAEFIFHDLGGVVVYDPEQDPDDALADSWYEGDYKPRTVLDHGIAVEVLLNNVLGDNHTADIPENGQALLVEAARLLKDDGVVIIRESITPFRVHFTKDFLASTGLGKVAKLRGDDYDRINTWDELEKRFNAGQPLSPYTQPMSFYAFLKPAHSFARL